MEREAQLALPKILSTVKIEMKTLTKTPLDLNAFESKAICQVAYMRVSESYDAVILWIPLPRKFLEKTTGGLRPTIVRSDSGQIYDVLGLGWHD